MTVADSKLRDVVSDFFASISVEAAKGEMVVSHSMVYMTKGIGSIYLSKDCSVALRTVPCHPPSGLGLYDPGGVRNPGLLEGDRGLWQKGGQSGLFLHQDELCEQLFKCHWAGCTGGKLLPDLEGDMVLDVLKRVPVNTLVVWCSRMHKVAKNDVSCSNTVDLQPLNCCTSVQTNLPQSPITQVQKVLKEVGIVEAKSTCPFLKHMIIKNVIDNVC